MSNKPEYLYMYNPQTGQFEWVKQPIEGTPQPIENTTLSEFLGSFTGSDNFDLSNIMGSFGKSIGNMPTSQSSIGSTDNLQANWGIQNSIANNIKDKVSQREESLKNSFLDKATTRFSNTFSSDPLTAESAKNKMTDFLNSKSGLIKGGSGMSKDPSAYVTAAMDIAKFSSDIADSAKSKMSLPSQYNYNSNNVRDIYGHSQFFKSAGVPMSFAGKRPNFINSFTDINKKSVKGAMDGYNISNNWIGALIGGVVGAGLGIGNTFAKLHTYNQNKYRIGRYNDINDRNYNLAQRDIQSNIWSTNNNIMNLQRTANIGALGGQIDNSEIAGVTTFNAGGTHETNPNGGIPQGIGENGKPNLVEEGEVKWNDFIFSKRIKPQDDILKQYNSFFKGGVTSYADAATKILDMHKERENNPFDVATLNIQMRRLADAQEYQKIAEEAAQYGMTPEEYVSRQQQLVNNQNNNSFAEGGPLRKIKGITQAQENWDVQLQRPYYYADQAGNPAEGPNKYTKHTYWSHQVACDIIRSFAGRYQRYEEASKELVMSQNMYNDLVELLNDPNRMAQLQVTADDVLNEIQNAWSGIQSVQNKYNTYKKAFDYSRLLVQNVFAYYKVLDGDNTGTGSHTWRLRSYLNDIGHFDGTAKDSDGTPLYLTGSQLYRNYCVNVDAEKHFKQLQKNRPNIFPLIHEESVRENSKWTMFRLGDPGSNKYMWNGKSKTSAKQNTSSQNTASVSTSNNVINGSSNNIVNNNVPRVPSVMNNQVVTKYYDPSIGKFVNADPDNPNLYKVTNVKGLDGNINYDDNPNFVQQRDLLTDEDWNNILNELKSKYGNKYNNYNVDDLKEKAQDGLFGNIHREIAQYINNHPKSVPQDNSTNLTTEQPKKPILATNTNPTNTEDVTEDEDQTTSITDKVKSPILSSILRSAPILNNIRQIIEQDAPDYTYSNQLKSLYRPSTYRPVGQYQRYQPVDQHYLDTQAQQQRNSLYGFYRNNAQSNAAANFLATMAAANANHIVNQAYATALQQNNQNRNAAIAANNQLDLQNEANRMNTERINNANYANIMGSAYAAAEQERLAVENAIESNYNNLADNLGNLGRELYDRWRIDNDPSTSYKTNWQYKNMIPLWNAFNEFMQERNRG